MSVDLVKHAGKARVKAPAPGSSSPSSTPAPSERPTFVWIVDEDALTVARREVNLDAVTARGARLTERVETGDWVVTAGVHSLVEGQKVRISQTRAE